MVPNEVRRINTFPRGPRTGGKALPVQSPPYPFPRGRGDGGGGVQRRGSKAYDYFRAFDEGLSDREVAEAFRVSVETVAQYRRLPRYYDLLDLEDLVLALRRRRAHLSTIFRAVQEDPGFRPFDGMLLLHAICRVLRGDDRTVSRLEAQTVLRRAFDPEIHDSEQREAILALAGHRKGETE